MKQDKNNKESMTSVWLDMSSCSLPRGYDASRVRPSIESAFKRSVGSLFAYGDMKKLSPRVIRGMSFSGISVVHSHFGLRDVMNRIHSWKRRNPPPANVMLISLDYRVVAVSRYLPLVPLEAMYPRDKEFNVIRGFPSVLSPDELHWRNLLETTILEEEGGLCASSGRLMPRTSKRLMCWDKRLKCRTTLWKLGYTLSQQVEAGD